MNNVRAVSPFLGSAYKNGKINIMMTAEKLKMVSDFNTNEKLDLPLHLKSQVQQSRILRGSMLGFSQNRMLHSASPALPLSDNHNT